MNAIVPRDLVQSSVKFGVVKSGNIALKQFSQTYGHNESHIFLNSTMCVCDLWAPA
jgi:hypothetical protein